MFIKNRITACLVFIFFGLLSISQSLFADLTGFGLGITETMASAEDLGWSIKAKSGISVNYLLVNTISPYWESRMTLSLNQKTFSLNTGTNNTSDYKLNYLEIPWAIGYTPVSFLSLYGGASLAISSSTECNYSSGGRCPAPKGISEYNTGYILGSNIRLLEDMALDFSVTSYSSSLFNKIKGASMIRVEFYFIVELR